MAAPPIVSNEIQLPDGRIGVPIYIQSTRSQPVILKCHVITIRICGKSLNYDRQASSSRFHCVIARASGVEGLGFYPRQSYTRDYKTLNMCFFLCF